MAERTKIIADYQGQADQLAELAARCTPDRAAEGDWALSGEHDEDGTLSLEGLIAGYVEHTAHHLRQVNELIGE